MTNSPYYNRLYSKLRRGIICHPSHVDENNVEDLLGFDFVFLCIDDGPGKRAILQRLGESTVPFIDVGLGVQQQDGSLGGILRVTTSTKDSRDHVSQRVSTGETAANDDYDTNIQIADLNALNAALAVIRWKKLAGFYRDHKGELNSLFTIDTNQLINEDH